MAVHLTRIYTRTGDDGTTALGDMSRVRKTDARVAAYADCDETNAAIGVALALGNLPERITAVLGTIQNDLFDVGADLCTPVVPAPKYPPLRVEPSYVERLEGWCDEFNAEAPKLDSFILPGGTPGAALLHQARTLSRRAERSAWALWEADEEHTNRDAMLYLNRLSDLLFILCRIANPDGDVLWHPGGDPGLIVDFAPPPVLVLMGVTGCGKSTVAGVLHGRLGWPMCEGDDLHPAANIEKMASGHPLTDDDRWPWLARVRDWIDARIAQGSPALVTCSALRRAYRDVLRDEHVVFVHLDGTRDHLLARLAGRHGHFMPVALLDSQLSTLEPPGPDEQAIRIDISSGPAEQADRIVKELDS